MEGFSKYFESYGYLVVRSAIQKRFAEVLNEYALRFATSGATGDSQVPGSPARYGDPLMERVLEDLLPGLEQVSGRRLYPTYSYFRVYRQGDILHRHRDRPSCEISLSLTLGYQADEPWPLFVEGPGGAYEARLEPGDGLLYKGMECDHWRNQFQGVSASQAFFHYVDRDGRQTEWRFDKRSALNRA
jgi:hypothetical protein